jgi:hypothetical protein
MESEEREEKLEVESAKGCPSPVEPANELEGEVARVL